MRPLLFIGALLGCLVPYAVQSQVKGGSIPAAGYANADIEQLSKLLGIQQDQLGKSRALLVQAEEKIAADRAQALALESQMKKTLAEAYQQIATTLPADKAEQLRALIEKDQLPLVWTTMEEVNKASGRDTPPASKEKIKPATQEQRNAPKTTATP